MKESLEQADDMCTFAYPKKRTVAVPFFRWAVNTRCPAVHEPPGIQHRQRWISNGCYCFFLPTLISVTTFLPSLFSVVIVTLLPSLKAFSLRRPFLTSLPFWLMIFVS